MTIAATGHLKIFLWLSGGLESDPIAGYTYDVNGNRVSQVYPQNQLETTYSYNKANIVTQLVNKKGTDVVSEYSYTYTIDGNQSGKTGPDGTTSYIYDRMGRLTQESIDSWHTIDYSYDAFSNRARMEVSGQDGNYVTTYTYDKNNRLLAETKTEDSHAEIRHYSYDANGNQIRRERQKARAKTEEVGHIGFVEVAMPAGKAVTLDSRHYNGFNQLVRVYRDGTVTNFTYRPDALRHSKQTYDGNKAYRPRPTVHYWDGSNIVLETNTNDFIKAVYLRGITLIAQVMGESVMLYLHNAHGDVVQQVNASGDAAPTYEYDAFGNQKEPNEEDPNPFRYCGEYFDKETEEVYLRNRYYDPSIGRFGQRDRAENGLNWYVYCSGNPVMQSDPTGLGAVWDWVKKTASNAWNGIKNGVSKAWNWAKRTWHNITDDYPHRPGSHPNYNVPDDSPTMTLSNSKVKSAYPPQKPNETDEQYSHRINDVSLEINAYNQFAWTNEGYSEGFSKSACYATCILSVAQYYGNDIKMSDLTAIGKDGTSSVDASSASVNHSYPYFSVTSAIYTNDVEDKYGNTAVYGPVIKDSLKKGNPVIIVYTKDGERKKNHYVVAVAVTGDPTDPNSITVMDPSTGKTMTLKDSLGKGYSYNNVQLCTPMK